jgi:hypothetical protein
MKSIGSLRRKAMDLVQRSIAAALTGLIENNLIDYSEDGYSQHHQPEPRICQISNQ